jgi:hypothetical protein
MQEYFDYDMILKIFRHKKRQDEHNFHLNSHTLITFM